MKTKPLTHNEIKLALLALSQPTLERFNQALRAELEASKAFRACPHLIDCYASRVIERDYSKIQSLSAHRRTALALARLVFWIYNARLARQIVSLKIRTHGTQVAA